MTEPLTPTPTPWFCENDGIYNAARSYLITPTGDSDQDRADAAHIVAVVNEIDSLQAARIRAEELVEQRVNVIARMDREVEGYIERALRAEKERDELRHHLTSEIAALKPTLDRLARAEEALRAIANDGCDGVYDENVLTDCLTLHPTCFDFWCRSCVALAVLSTSEPEP